MHRVVIHVAARWHNTPAVFRHCLHLNRCVHSLLAGAAILIPVSCRRGDETQDECVEVLLDRAVYRGGNAVVWCACCQVVEATGQYLVSARCAPCDGGFLPLSHLCSHNPCLPALLPFYAKGVVCWLCHRWCCRRAIRLVPVSLEACNR